MSPSEWREPLPQCEAACLLFVHQLIPKAATCQYSRIVDPAVLELLASSAGLFLQLGLKKVLLAFAFLPQKLHCSHFPTRSLVVLGTTTISQPIANDALVTQVCECVEGVNHGGLM